MIKTIIFDLGGVYFTDGMKRAVRKMRAKYDISEDKLYDVFDGELGTQYRARQKTWNENDTI
jgi:hypothetical protein